MKKITFRQEPNKIVIEIPVDLLVHVTENHPDREIGERGENCFKVINKEALVKDVMFLLKEDNSETESGLTAFQELIDGVIYEAYSQGSEAFNQ